MRHTRARRRLKFILASLLILSIIMFFETRIESFAPQLKIFAQAKVEEGFGRNIRLSIGSLDGGILRPIVLNDIRVMDAGGREILPFLKINKIASSYRLWDFLFRKNGAGSAMGFLSRGSYIYINFETVNGEIGGFLRLRGDIGDAALKGYITLFGEERIDLTGAFKDGAFELSLKPRNKSGVIDVKGTLSADGYVATNLKISHIKLLGLDIVSEADLKNRIVNDDIRPGRFYVKGEVATKNLILNYKPFLELRSSYKIADGMLDISNLELGKDFKVTGRIFLREPCIVDILITADNANLNLLLADLGAPSDSILTGIISGRLRLKGQLNNLKSESKFELRDGTIGGLEFEHLSASLKGEGPVVKIEDSMIRRESGYFILAGEMDFRKLGKPAMFEGIKMASSETAVIWDGWDITKMPNIEEFRMKKKMTEDINLGFKKSFDNKAMDESVRERDEVEFEYKLQGQGNEALKLSVGQDDSFFGLEHKDKF